MNQMTVQRSRTQHILGSSIRSKSSNDSALMRNRFMERCRKRYQDEPEEEVKAVEFEYKFDRTNTKPIEVSRYINEKL